MLPFLFIYRIAVPAYPFPFFCISVLHDVPELLCNFVCYHPSLWTALHSFKSYCFQCFLPNFDFLFYVNFSSTFLLYLNSVTISFKAKVARLAPCKAPPSRSPRIKASVAAGTVNPAVSFAPAAPQLFWVYTACGKKPAFPVAETGFPPPVGMTWTPSGGLKHFCVLKLLLSPAPVSSGLFLWHDFCLLYSTEGN